MKELLGVRELARAISVSPSTITYYTNLGLFKVVKIKGNKRLYNRDLAIQRFSEIQKSRQEGYSLMLIKKRLIEKSKKGS